MKRTRRRRWPWWLLGILLAVAGLYYANQQFLWFPLPWQITSQETFIEGQPPSLPLVETSPIQRAADVIPDLTVSGKLEFRTVKELLAPFEGTVQAVYVQNGAQVKAGDPIASQDLNKLSEELNAAWLDLTKSRQALADLAGQGAAIELMEANAELLTAQEELEKLEKGPTGAEITSAKLAISEAQLAYEELIKRNDPNSTKVRQARYALKQAANNVERAQTAYNAIAWKGDIAASGEATNLQSATITLESAQNDYDEAIKPPTDLELQKAQNAIAQAQSAYNKLFTQATPAQVEQAKVRVAKAQEKVKQLQNGPAPLKLQEAEAEVLQKLNAVEEVRTKLLNTQNLQAPFDGQIVKLPVKPGQVVKAGDTIAVIVAPDQFKLTLAVSELYILRITTGMTVQIALDVLPNEPVTGTVTGITPPEVQTSSSDGSQSSGSSGGTQFTTYPVTVAVEDSPAGAQLRAGMSTQVTFVGTNQLEPNSWLVPASAIENQADGVGTIQVMRGDQSVPIEVKVTEQTQGEWVVVVSPDLQDGDQVVGATATFLNVQPGGFGP